MVDIMSLVYSGYSEVIHGKLIHLKQFLEAARLRDAGFENVRRPECLGDLSPKITNPTNLNNRPLQTVQGTDLQHHQFLRYSDQAENLSHHGKWSTMSWEPTDQERYPGPKLLASMQRSSVCWNVSALTDFACQKT